MATAPRSCAGSVGEGAVEGADRRAGGADDDDIGHGIILRSAPVATTALALRYGTGVAAASIRAGTQSRWLGSAQAALRDLARCRRCFRSRENILRWTQRARRLAGSLATCLSGDEGDGEGERADDIKKYANRRLYHTGTSTYVTLEDLGTMVKPARISSSPTPSRARTSPAPCSTQIIFEQEDKGQNLLPITFLRQLIRFYGDQIQAIVPSYLEFSIDNLAREQQKFRDQMTQHIATGWSKAPWAAGSFGTLEEQAKNNMAVFERAFRMFSPFNQRPPSQAPSRRRSPRTRTSTT